MNQENSRFEIVTFKRATVLLAINSVILAVSGVLLSDETTFFNEQLAILILGLVSIALIMHNYVVINLTYSGIG